MKQQNQVTPKRVFQYMIGIVRKKPRPLFIIIFFRTITAVAPLLIPLYFKKIIDTISVVGGAPTPEIVQVVLGFVWIIVIIELIQQGAFRVLEYFLIDVELSGMRRIYKESFVGLHRHAYRFFIDSFGGTLVKRVNKIVFSFEKVVDMFIFSIYPLLITIVMIFVVIVSNNRILGMILFAWVVAFVVVQFVLYSRKLPYEHRAHQEDAKTTGALADTVTNHHTISVFGSLQRETNRFNRQVDKRSALWRKNWIMGNYIHMVNGLFISVIVFLILRFSVRFWAAGSITVGTIVLLQFYLFRLIEKIYDIGNIFKRCSHAIGEAGEMLTILDTAVEIADSPSALPLQVTHGSISFDQVRFAYSDGAAPVFEGLSLTIHPGEKVALVGQSGAGKSSITKLLLRYFDIQSGAICIDGQNIASVTQESLRSSLSLVPQEPILFHRSLRENIAYGNPDATNEQIIAAAKIARCHEFIIALENGYETLVGERGVKLSGGERQRVAIARAILEDKKILILDEATSSLDSESEKLIQEAIHELIKDKTAIVIAHRLSTIKEMDRIIVFHDGAIIEQGSHDELLSLSGGTYRKLRTIQSTA